MVREIRTSERVIFDKFSPHPLQSFAWGEFREKTGLSVLRFGRFVGGKLLETAQITVHPIPKTKLKIAYWPKGEIPTKEMLKAVRDKVKQLGVIMVKLEPNMIRDEESTEKIGNLKKEFPIKSGKSLFTNWSLGLDLNKTEEELLQGMKQKTRYNTRLAERKGVRVIEDSSMNGFEEYWRLTEETTKRQGFYAHTKKYHRLMFETLSRAGMAHLFRAEYEGKTLATWIVFVLNKKLYYPYGASTRDDRGVFASNLLMWEVIKFGKRQGCTWFDMWGSPGPEPKPTDPWAGFHRFKEGYGAKLVEFVGTYDLVINPVAYQLYLIGDKIRWMILKLVRKVS